MKNNQNSSLPIKTDEKQSKLIKNNQNSSKPIKPIQNGSKWIETEENRFDNNSQ